MNHLPRQMIHVLQAMGAVVGLSDTILGLTVLAFANSVPPPPPSLLLPLPMSLLYTPSVDNNSVHRPPLQPLALLSRTLPAADLKE